MFHIEQNKAVQVPESEKEILGVLEKPGEMIKEQSKMFHVKQNKAVQVSKSEKEILRALGKVDEMRNQEILIS